MKTVIIVEFVLMTTFGYLLTGIYMQGDLTCRQIDFNNIDSVSEFETCATRIFTIKSYLDEPSLTPFRPESVNYLSNIQPGFSCFSSMESFTLDENTDFHFAIYLQSLIVDDASFVEIKVINVDGVNSVTVIRAVVIGRWNEYYYRSEGPLENVKIQIEAFMTSDARLAIEYLYITNTGIIEPECEIGGETTVDTTIETTVDTIIETTVDTTIETTVDTTIETTDIDTTIETTDIDTTIETTDVDTTIKATTDTTIEATTDATDTTTETTTEATTTIETTPTTIASTTSTDPIPIDSNDTNVWIILSFVFLLTTIVAIVALVYLIYLYKTALAMKSILLSAPTVQSAVTSLPRLTVETSSRGNQVIVGIEKFKHI